VARGEVAHESDLVVALVVRSQTVTEQLRESLKPVEDAQQIRISLAALAGKKLAALLDSDPWWANVVCEGRVLEGTAPNQVRRLVARSAV